MRKFNIKKAIALISAAVTLGTTAAITPITSFAATTGTRERLVEVAEKYANMKATYKTFNYTYDWCAAFAHRCTNEAGGKDYSSSAFTTQTLLDYKAKNKYHARITTSWTCSTRSCSTLSQDTYYTPQVGDLVLIETNNNWNDGPDHTGLVVGVSGNGINATITTIEGNTNGDKNAEEYYKTSSVNKFKNRDISKVWGYCSPDYSNSTYLAGDLNLDGKVDITDCSYLSLYLLGDTTLASIAGNESATRKNADVNGDGKINLVDLATLKSIVAKVGNTSDEKDVRYTKQFPANTPIYADAGSSTINQYLSSTQTLTIIKEKTINGVKYGKLLSGAGWVKL